MNMRKAVMVGCGFVGSASVFALMQSGLFSEIALIDANREKAEGEAMDISHGIPFASQMRIYAGDYDDVKNLSNLMKIINQPVFGCDFRYPESDWIPNSDGKKPYSDIANISACITSDISVTKVMSENAVKGGLYIVSATLEEV